MDIKDIKIINAWSWKNDLVFTFRESGILKKLVIKDYPWYFVVHKDDFEKHHQLFQSLRNQGLFYKDLPVGDYIKIYTDKREGKTNSEARMILQILEQNKISTFEADLHSAKRYMVDNDVKVSDKYEILYFDIETDDTERKIEIGKHKILSFAAIDSEGNKFYCDDPDEKVVIKTLLELFKKYDVVAGWNIYEFDIPYIEERMKLHNITFKWYRVATIDMMKRAIKLFKEDATLKSYSLENVSNHFLGHGKVKYEGKIIDMYNNQRELFKEYNLRDVELLKDIDEKTGMIDLIAKECALSNTLMIDFTGLWVSEILDNMILREAHKHKLFCPTKLYNVERTEYSGGYVLDPEVGLHSNVHVFDFKSLYPSIIMTFNLGFDSLATQDTPSGEINMNPGTGLYFRTDKQSVIAKVVSDLVEARQVYKNERLRLVGEGKLESDEYNVAKANEIIVKELSNSVYGIMGNPNIRYYSTAIASSITKTGQYLIKYSRDWFESQGHRVIYGDTDSIFVIPKGLWDVEKELEQYHKDLFLHLCSKFGIKRSYIYLKYEKLFKNIILLGKKYYIGNVINIEGKEVNNIVAKGLDMVKKAALPMATKFQKKIVDMIFSNEPKESIELYIKQMKDKMMKDEFSFDDLKISVKIGKDIEEYKAKNAPHVKLARKIIEEKGYLESKEIEYVVVDNNLPKDSLQGHALRDMYNGSFDRIYYWNQRIYPGAIRILEAAYPTINWKGYLVKSSRRQRNIDQLTLF